MDCEHCEASFTSEKERLEHALDAHRDDMSSHDVDDAKRRLNKLRAEQPSQNNDLLRIAGMAAIALAVLGGGGYLVFQSGLIEVSSPTGAVSNGGQNVPLGRPGTTHEHMAFSVTVDGERTDFSQQRYQLQSDHLHFEGGDGSTIHKHATGVTIGYTLDTLGMGINASCLEMRDGTTYCEPGDGELSVTAGGEPVNASYILQDGVPVEIMFTTG